MEPRRINEIGRVVSVGDGIARVYGLNEIQAGEGKELIYYFQRPTTEEA